MLHVSCDFYGTNEIIKSPRGFSFTDYFRVVSEKKLEKKIFHFRWPDCELL